MRDPRTYGVTWASLSWVVPLAFLVVPNCGFPGAVPNPNLQKGSTPHNAVVFCDIEQHAVHGWARRCADNPTNPGLSVPMQSAAVDLTRGINGVSALDHSPQAIQPDDEQCMPGQPVEIFFQNSFPRGTPICLNADEVIGPGRPYPDADAACVAACYDRFGDWSGTTLFPDNPPSPETQLFCSQRARASTNVGEVSHISFLGGCTDAGTLTADFVDPRRTPEPVHWRDKSAGIAASGSLSNTLTRNAASTGAFDRGAASVQSITRGDGYLEFTASETVNMDRACGLSPGTGPDTDPSLDGIGFAVRLADSGGLIIHESGAAVIPVMPYFLGDGVRIKFADNLDGTASITYHLIPAACSGPTCEGSLLRTATSLAAYPLRVDASLATQGATLANVRLVRIK